jgi:antitoxin component YwqK of YwqJK toxin-antitoxin module
MYGAGKLHGQMITWRKNGQKEGEGEYCEGKMHGIWMIWHENGQLIELMDECKLGGATRVSVAASRKVNGD